ncbi:hypothetical protein KYC5002_33150 [Archangium violaceum]|uniref:hypothetical protein n=1 Tax=Archangium violaceum TaxID=83451 RepID=UPI002B309C22|nr:hypothetical protein KYC5002_33150 [Archangium gephyra]
MFSLTTSLALAAALTLSPQDAAPTEPSAPTAVEAFAPSTSAPAEATAPAESGKRELSRITLKDGQELHGVVVRQDNQVVVVELADGDRLELPARQVKDIAVERNAQVRDNGEIWFQDPNRTRYLYAPSGMMLRQGEGYFSQKELFFSSINYGLTDFITVQAGAVFPAWVINGGFNFIGGVKVGGSVGDRLHLAAGAQGLVIPGVAGGLGGTLGFVFGTATYGTPDAHLSLGVGKPFTLSNSGGELDRNIIATLSGNVRLSQRVALVTENWLIPTLGTGTGDLPMLNSLAVRLFGESWAVDLGGIRVPGLPIPIPWLDFAYNFG